MQLKSRLPWTLVAELRRKGSPKGKASERRWVAEENLLPTFLWSGESHLGGRPPCQAVGFHLAPASEAGTRLPLLSQQLSWLTVQVPGLSPHSMDGPVPPHGLTSCLNRSAGPHCLLILLTADDPARVVRRVAVSCCFLHFTFEFLWPPSSPPRSNALLGHSH